ncbi:MAG: DUF4810 domain-containing protein [Zoogloeaceae bacterium]|jgi:hypothetical protein|nr:DUF4810 domain-containing protein [Zoogloeaceae bacterium]
MKRESSKTWLLTVLALAFSGCATAPESLYAWGSYEEQVYAHFNGASREAEIEALERDLEHANASGKTPPPGFFAHLGLLYLETGKDEKAVECFTTEKTRFPEAAAFMDFLLKKQDKRGETRS